MKTIYRSERERLSWRLSVLLVLITFLSLLSLL